MVRSDGSRYVVCPECGLPAVPIMYGYPSEYSATAASAGLLELGGCVVGPGVPNLACPRGHRWRNDEPDGPDAAEHPAATEGPDGPEVSVMSAARRYAAGDLDGAERDYRHLLATSARQRGVTDAETRALNQALTIVLAAAGRLEARRASPTYAPSVRRRAWGGWALTVALSWVLVAWFAMPLVWIIVSDAVAPESGVDPTPAQVRTAGWVDLSWWTVAVALPLIVFAVAALTRRRLLAVLGAVGVVVPNLLLILAGHPIWQLLAAAVDMIVSGISPGSRV